jgi:hypothetical protein
MGGQIVDASIIAAPKQRNTDAPVSRLFGPSTLRRRVVGG